MIRGAVFTGSVEGVQLNPVCTLSAAVIGTGVVLAGLLFVFSRQVTLPLAPAHVLLRVIPAAVPLAAVGSARRTAQPAASSSGAHTVALPQPLNAEVLPNLSGPVASKLDLSMGIPSPTAAPTTGSGPHAFNPYSDLNRVLTNPPKQPILKNGQMLRLVGFPPITKIAGHCYVESQLPTIGLSPKPKQKIVSRVPCPGSYRPSMDDELDIWADKEKKKLYGNCSG